ncbi:MAG: transcriptional regulator [Firmicutes bacterium]|nr:transcriptional regulator [Bacillota bacterium]
MRNRLKELCEEYNLNYEELADKVHVKKQTILSIENGKYNLSLGLAHNIAQVFKLPIEEIFLLETNDEPAKFSRFNKFSRMGIEFFAIGVLLFLAERVFTVDTSPGIAFIILGLWEIYEYIIAPRKAKIMKNLELSNDERSLFITAKSRSRAFMISLICLFIIDVSGLITKINIPTAELMLSIFFLLSGIWICLELFYHKKY